MLTTKQKREHFSQRITLSCCNYRKVLEKKFPRNPNLFYCRPLENESEKKCFRNQASVITNIAKEAV